LFLLCIDAVLFYRQLTVVVCLEYYFVAYVAVRLKEWD